MFNLGDSVLNSVIIKKYIMLIIKYELNVLEWRFFINGFVEFKIIKDNKNKGICFRYKKINNSIIDLVKFFKSICSEYWIFRRFFLVNDLLFVFKYFVKK